MTDLRAFQDLIQQWRDRSSREERLSDSAYLKGHGEKCVGASARSVVYRRCADELAAALVLLQGSDPQPFVSCQCPAKKGENCPLTAEECNAREAQFRAAGSDPQARQEWQPMGSRLALMNIRRWVDEGVMIHRRENGIATPTGLAGSIAAQVWLHVLDAIDEGEPAVCHCQCARAAHVYYRQGGIFTACKICHCEAYEPIPHAPAPPSAPERQE